MKRIVLRAGGKFPTRDVLRIVLEQSPNRSLDVGAIRKRVKVLDILDEVDDDADSFIVEDAMHATLTEAVNGFPWQQATKELLRVIDDVLDAAPVSTAPLKSVPSVADATIADATPEEMAAAE